MLRADRREPLGAHCLVDDAGGSHEFHEIHATVTRVVGAVHIARGVHRQLRLGVGTRER